MVSAPGLALACSITVTGVVVVTGQLSVTPTDIAFGTASRYSARLKTVTLKTCGNTPETIGKELVAPNAGTGDHVFSSLALCPSSLAAGKSCSVTVLLFADSVGLKPASLKMPNSAAGSPQTVALSVKVVPKATGT